MQCLSLCLPMSDTWTAPLRNQATDMHAIAVHCIFSIFAIGKNS